MSKNENYDLKKIELHKYNLDFSILQDNKKLFNRIHERKNHLDYAKSELKKHFIGIDSVIDKIFNNIEAWYILPELVTRPIIINLWGLTGVGKTDLVRRLVKLLGYEDRFLEEQLTNKSNGYKETVEELLKFSSIEETQPGIVLFDEIQRFRSIDEDGHEIHDYAYQDLWTLLSDGQVSGEADKKRQIIRMIFDNAYSEERNSNKNNQNFPDCPIEGLDIDDDSDKSKKYKRKYYRAEELKALLKLKEPVNEIMTWDKEKVHKLLIGSLNKKNIFNQEDYTKLLIFISGNLDEAYEMASSTDDADIDADIFYDNSLKITINTIKEQLLKRFRAEQIARFGNAHIIYPSLNRKSFEKIIYRKVLNVNNEVFEKTKIKIESDQSVYDFLYRNGVYPAQGTRPIFTTITSCWENKIPKIILWCIENKINNVKIDYYFHKDKKGYIVREKDSPSQGVKETFIPCEGDLDNIKGLNNSEDKAITSVHEAGHAIIYAYLFNKAPNQIISVTTSKNNKGYIYPHKINHSKKQSIDFVTVLMGGRVAEELVFGEHYISNGASGDIECATRLAVKMYRSWGFFDSLSTHQHSSVQGQNSFWSVYSDIEKMDKKINKLILNKKEEAKKILKKNNDLFKEVSEKLYHNGKIDPEDFIKIYNKYIPSSLITVEKSGFTVYESNRLENFYKFLGKSVDKP